MYLKSLYSSARLIVVRVIYNLDRSTFRADVSTRGFEGLWNSDPMKELRSTTLVGKAKIQGMRRTNYLLFCAFPVLNLGNHMVSDALSVAPASFTHSSASVSGNNRLRPKICQERLFTNVFDFICSVLSLGLSQGMYTSRFSLAGHLRDRNFSL